MAKGFGPRSVSMAGELVELVTRWDAAGRPSSEGLRVDAYPRGATERPPGRNGATIERPTVTLTLSWW